MSAWYRAGSDHVALVGQAVHFKASTGEVLREEPPPSTVGNINEFLIGLHLQHFEHWLLRWLYVLGGLLGCICIATGFIFFVEKRKRKHAEASNQGSRIVDALAVTTVTGMLIATIGMLVVNRLLPAELVGKGDWEKLAFWGIWLLALLHALWRSAPVAQARKNPALARAMLGNNRLGPGRRGAELAHHRRSPDQDCTYGSILGRGGGGPEPAGKRGSGSLGRAQAGAVGTARNHGCPQRGGGNARRRGGHRRCLAHHREGTNMVEATAIYLIGATLATVLGFAWLALAMELHWK